MSNLDVHEGMPDVEYLISYVYQGRTNHKHGMTKIRNNTPMKWIEEQNDKYLVFDDDEYVLLNFWEFGE